MSVVRTELTFGGGEAVEVLVRQRGRRYDISDGGRAVELAGRPPGWLERAEREVAEVGLNVNRRGVVFVSVVEGRDIEALTQRVAETSRAVYAELLELCDAPSSPA